MTESPDHARGGWIPGPVMVNAGTLRRESHPLDAKPVRATAAAALLHAGAPVGGRRTGYTRAVLALYHENASTVDALLAGELEAALIHAHAARLLATVMRRAQLLKLRKPQSTQEV